MVPGSFYVPLIVELANLEDCLQASVEKPDEPSQLSSTQRTTRGVNISNSYSSLLSKSVQKAKALKATDLEKIQLPDVEVLVTF